MVSPIRYDLPQRSRSRPQRQPRHYHQQPSSPRSQGNRLFSPVPRPEHPRRGGAELRGFAMFVEDFSRDAPTCLAQSVRSAAIRRAMARIGNSWQPLTRATNARRSRAPQPQRTSWRRSLGSRGALPHTGQLNRGRGGLRRRTSTHSKNQPRVHATKITPGQIRWHPRVDQRLGMMPLNTDIASPASILVGYTRPVTSSSSTP